MADSTWWISGTAEARTGLAPRVPATRADRRRWRIAAVSRHLALGALLGLASACADEEEPAAPAPADVLSPDVDPATTLAPPPAPAPGAGTAWNEVVATYVRGGRFDYIGARTPSVRAAIALAVTHYADTDLPLAPADRLAFWINAYNVNVIAQVLEAQSGGDFTTVQAQDGFFDRVQIVVAGEYLTFDSLENDRVRPLGDPRIHAALVCGAVSCPPLRQEAFSGPDLERQLDEQCRAWVNDESKFRVVNGQLGFSRILEWYGDDFETPPFGSARGFVLAYLNPSSPMARGIADAMPVTWLAYDWSLNQAP